MYKGGGGKFTGGPTLGGGQLYEVYSKCWGRGHESRLYGTTEFSLTLTTPRNNDICDFRTFQSGSLVFLICTESSLALGLLSINNIINLTTLQSGSLAFLIRYQHHSHLLRSLSIWFAYSHAII